MIELPHKRTARTADYSIGGSKFVQKVWGADRFYLSGGVFAECDSTVKPAGQGWKLDTMPYNATLPSQAGGVLGFKDVRLAQKNIEYQIEAAGALPVDGIVIPGEVTYPNAYGPGCDLAYQIRASGIAKLVRVQPNSPVLGPFLFQVELPPNAIVKRRAAGSEYVVQPTGKKHTDTARLTVIEVDGKETYLNPFMWKAGDQFGILPMDIEYVGGRWEFTKVIPAEWDRSAPLEMDLTASGTAVSDGYVGYNGGASYAVARDAATGSGIDFTSASSYLFLKRGDATRICLRGCLSFSNTVDVSALVSDVSHTVTVYGTAAGYTGTFVQWSPSNPASPTTSDYAVDPPNTGAGKIGSVDWGTSKFDPATTGAKTVALTATGLTAFNKNGTNSYAVRETGSDFARAAYTGGVIAANIRYSEYATAGERPVQTITYTMPSTIIPPGSFGALASNKTLGSLAS